MEEKGVLERKIMEKDEGSMIEIGEGRRKKKEVWLNYEKKGERRRM